MPEIENLVLHPPSYSPLPRVAEDRGGRVERTLPTRVTRVKGDGVRSVVGTSIRLSTRKGALMMRTIQNHRLPN